MTVEFKDFKEIAKGKTISFIGKIKTKFSTSQIHNLLDKVRGKNEERLLQKIEKYSKEIEAQEKVLESENTTEKGAENAREIIYRNRVDLDKTRKKLDKLYKTKKLEYETINKLRDYFPQLEVEELPKLESYYDTNTDRFYISGEEFNPNVYEDKIAIINNFKDYEYSGPGKWARALQNYGAATVGEDFIRLFSASDNERKDQFTDALQGTYLEIEEKIGPKEMIKLNEKPANKIREFLSTLNLPNLRHLIEPVKKEIIDPETVEISKPAIEAQVEQAEKQMIDPDMVDAIKPAVETEPEPEPMPEPEKDKYTIAIEQAKEKQEEIRTKIQALREDYLAEVDATELRPFETKADIMANTYGEVAEKRAVLEQELEAAIKEENDAFEARRQEKIEQMKKEREERIKAINENAAKQEKEKQALAKLEEAKTFLSNIETSTGKYDISNLTDEEIMEVYDAVTNPKSAAERNASEEAINAKESTPEATSNQEETNQPVEPAQDLQDNQDDVVNALMNSENFTEEQAKALANSDNPEVQDMVQNYIAQEVQNLQVETGGKTR